MSAACGVGGCESTTHTQKSHYVMQWQHSNKDAQLAILTRAREKRTRELAADPADPRHGRPASYVAGCRCDRCRGAHAEYGRANRVGRRFRASRNLRGQVGATLLALSWNTREEALAYIESRKRYPVADYQIHDMQEAAA